MQFNVLSIQRRRRDRKRVALIAVDHLKILAGVEWHVVASLQDHLPRIMIQMRQRGDRAIEDWQARLVPFHRREKFFIGFGFLHSVYHKLDRCKVVHFMDDLAQDPNLL